MPGLFLFKGSIGIKDKKVHKQVIRNIIDFCSSIGLNAQKLTFSPITGPAGNIEYLVYLKKTSLSYTVEYYKDGVKISNDDENTVDNQIFGNLIQEQAIEKNKYKPLLGYQDGKINFPYPRREFWDIAQSKNAMIVMNDDAHAPNRLHDDYTLKTYKFVTEGGIKIIDRIKGLND